MTIKRVLDGKEYEIELTDLEIREAAEIDQAQACYEQVVAQIDGTDEAELWTDETIAEAAKLFRESVEDAIIGKVGYGYLHTAMKQVIDKYDISYWNA